MKDFLISDEGRLASFNRRRARRISVMLSDIEPQTKRAPVAEQIRFQNAVAKQLTDLNRSTLLGDIALKLDITTTGKNAPQAHTLAKNILDLLGTRLDTVVWPKKKLLYRDDSQVQALTVSCRHGQSRPSIHIGARNFSAMLDDLELASYAIHALERESVTWCEEERDAECIDTLRDTIRDEALMRERLGDSTYETLAMVNRFNAQRVLLRRSSVALPVLSWMYGRPRNEYFSTEKEMWANLTTESVLRIQLGGLPAKSGESDVFKASVEREVATFKARWEKVISPLLLAVGLEVIVRPSPNTPKGVLHDLDNIVRDYLIAPIVRTFGTVTHHRWTKTYERAIASHPNLASSWGPMPPKATKAGVTRYEVWRLPPDPSESGFVSVALVADLDGDGDKMTATDRKIRDWSEMIVRKSRR